MVHCFNASDFYPYNKNTLVGASILSFLGLPGNVLVIILISRAKERKSTTTYLLLNLAIADILHLLGVDTVALLVFVVPENLQDAHNTTLLLLCISGELVANFTLALIALERHYSLTKTTKWCVNFTRNKFLAGIIVSWFIGLSLSLLMHFSDEWVDECMPPTTWHFRVYWVPPIVLGYFIPLVIQISCYWGLIKGLYVDKKILGRIIVSETVLNEKKRNIRTLITINLVFLACNVPVIMILLLQHASPEWEVEGRVYEAMLIVGILSSLSNPFLYGLQSDKYRSHIKELCYGKQKNMVEARSLPRVFDTKL